METLVSHPRFNLVRCIRRLSTRGKKNIVKISMTLVFLVFMIMVASLASIPSTRAYPSDAVFAKQINQTLESIIDYSQASSKIQSYINNEPSNLEQVVQQLIWQIYRTSNLDQTSQAVNEIKRQVTANPEGFTADSILWFAHRMADGQNYSVSQAIGNVAPPPSPANSVSSFDNIAVNDATYYADAAQTIFQGARAVLGASTGAPPSSGSSSDQGARAVLGASTGAPPSSGSSSDQYQSDQNQYQRSMIMKNNPNIASITRILGQTILGTALENGPGSAKQVLVQLTKELTSNPKGFTAHLVLAAASEDANGNFQASSKYIGNITNVVIQSISNQSISNQSISNQSISNQSISNQSISNQSRQLSCPVGLQPAASGNCQNTVAQLHPGVNVTNPGVNVTNPGVKVTNSAVSTAVKGPNTAAQQQLQPTTQICQDGSVVSIKDKCPSSSGSDNSGSSSGSGSGSDNSGSSSGSGSGSDNSGSSSGSGSGSDNSGSSSGSGSGS